MLVPSPSSLDARWTSILRFSGPVAYCLRFFVLVAGIKILRLTCDFPRTFIVNTTKHWHGRREIRGHHWGHCCCVRTAVDDTNDRHSHHLSDWGGVVVCYKNTHSDHSAGRWDRDTTFECWIDPCGSWDGTGSIAITRTCGVCSVPVARSLPHLSQRPHQPPHTIPVCVELSASSPLDGCRVL